MPRMHVPRILKALLARIRPDRLGFIGYHYIYITGCSLLAFVILYSLGNLTAIDAFFLAVSGNTESGLNTFDVKDLNVAQQLVLYFFPVITNLCFVNIGLVVIRLACFRKRLQALDPKPKQASWLPWPSKQKTCHSPRASDWSTDEDIEQGRLPAPRTPATPESVVNLCTEDDAPARPGHIRWAKMDNARSTRETNTDLPPSHSHTNATASYGLANLQAANLRGSDRRGNTSVDRVTWSTERSEQDTTESPGDCDAPAAVRSNSKVFAREVHESLERMNSDNHSVSSFQTDEHVEMLPWLSRQVTIGRNSNFHGLSEKDREELGGIEYRSLKVLLKVLIGLFVGLHVIGVVGLLPWIIHGPAHYRDYLASQGQDKVWWAFYSAQTMVTNLGFTLTPDSMVYFRDATWPMLLMTFLAFAGYNFHPILLRCIIWVAEKLSPKHVRESLRFLLDHPRRCYTLLFPSNVTWVLFGILFALNLVDVLLIILLDLDNEEVKSLPPGSRILAATFQAASARHTGTSSFALGDVNPAVQFSLLTMMYIAVFPIAMCVRSSNTYEERTLGIYVEQEEPDDTQGPLAYLNRHARNQLGFDLWYIFLGAFFICIAESGKIMDKSNHAFSEFAILFECTSAYGNVGLSLGARNTNTSLSGDLTVFSKLVICAMMWRGRHRGLPYDLDYAVMLPSDFTAQPDSEHDEPEGSSSALRRNNSALKRAKTL